LAYDKESTTVARDSGRLLWVPCEYSGSQKGKLLESERLTIAGYRERGVEVVELQAVDFDGWRAGAGKDLTRATRHRQLVAYANSIHADAVGGLEIHSFPPERARKFEGTPAGDYVYGWGISLGGCVSNLIPRIDASRNVQATPMGLISNEPWAIPKFIEARATCTSKEEAELTASMTKGKAFLGLAMEGQKIINVIPGSPAARAGLTVGDELLSVAGKPIENFAEMATIVSTMNPGQKVEFEIRRNDQRDRMIATLVDRFEVEFKDSPEGKPIPSLVGKDIDGNEVRLLDFRGKVILLEFWATWCRPCVEKMPLMQLAWENLKDKGLVWIRVSTDHDEAAWRTFVKDNQIGGIQLCDESWISAMAVNSFPTVFLVDREGIVQCRVRDGAIAQIAAGMLER
jgi:peroxiredoxin